MKYEEDIKSEVEAFMKLANYVVEVSSSYRPRQSFLQQKELDNIEYNIGYPLRKHVPIYNREIFLVRTARIRSPPEKMFFRKDNVMLNIIEVDPQLYDSYLE